MNLDQLHDIAISTLSELVTDQGIYASSNKGHEGLYYGFFGRDTCITASLILQAETQKNHFQYSHKAAQAVLNLGSWQGQETNPLTGEERGKITHEVRTDSKYYQHLTTELLERGEKSWYVDPNDNVMKNWDGIDSTALWVITVMRFAEAGVLTQEQIPLEKIRLALEWCMNAVTNSKGAFNHDAARPFGGLYNKGWKDSLNTYLHEHDGSKPVFPIQDVWVTALFWCAFKYGVQLFEEKDREFVALLEEHAKSLYEQFNSKDGFLIEDKKSGTYFAEGIDGAGQKLIAVSADPALAFWAYFGDECIIAPEHRANVVMRIFENDMFDPEAGLRIYSSELTFYDEIAYHRGQHTFWPFVSGLVVHGLDHFQYVERARELSHSIGFAIDHFGTAVELFHKNGSEYTRFKIPETGQTSCTDQAWTAGALYYVLNFLGA
jgi:glycogen debranching enzyme